jgi:hypothetical protein
MRQAGNFFKLKQSEMVGTRRPKEYNEQRERERRGNETKKESREAGRERE